MPPNLRDVTREFGRGEATLETLRQAARAERLDRPVADQILRLITDWENSPGSETDRAKNELRARVKQLVPPEPPPSASRREPGESIYAAGLRGQRRRP